jgi:carbonic anhydrase
MKKLMLLMAMLAVVLIAAAPAIAQTVAEKFSISANKSGPASPSFAFSNKGDNVNACPSDQQIANTGNVFNEQGAVQYNDKTEDISFAGSSITITPAETSECTQTIGQAAAAK